MCASYVMGLYYKETAKLRADIQIRPHPECGIQSSNSEGGKSEVSVYTRLTVVRYKNVTGTMWRRLQLQFMHLAHL